VRAAGVTVVGVLPTHRRRGVLRSMMRAQLDACRENGESVAYLWATEDTIYGRFGYGLASYSIEVDLPRERSAFHAPAEPFGQPRLVPLGEAEPLVAPVWERVAAVTPGMFARSSAWWQARALADPNGGVAAAAICGAPFSRLVGGRRRTRSTASTRGPTAACRSARSTSWRRWGLARSHARNLAVPARRRLDRAHESVAAAG